VESKIKNCVILAAGLGVRLKPLTDEEPKCLTEIGGKTILEQTLEVLEKNGIQETVIVVGYLGDVVIKKIGIIYGTGSTKRLTLCILPGLQESI
jgi:choline kinase